MTDNNSQFLKIAHRGPSGSKPGSVVSSAWTSLPISSSSLSDGESNSIEPNLSPLKLQLEGVSYKDKAFLGKDCVQRPFLRRKTPPCVTDRTVASLWRAIKRGRDPQRVQQLRRMLDVTSPQFDSATRAVADVIARNSALFPLSNRSMHALNGNIEDDVSHESDYEFISDPLTGETVVEYRSKSPARFLDDQIRRIVPDGVVVDPAPLVDFGLSVPEDRGWMTRAVDVVRPVYDGLITALAPYFSDVDLLATAARGIASGDVTWTGLGDALHDPTRWLGALRGFLQAKQSPSAAEHAHQVLSTLGYRSASNRKKGLRMESRSGQDHRDTVGSFAFQDPNNRFGALSEEDLGPTDVDDVVLKEFEAEAEKPEKAPSPRFGPKLQVESKPRMSVPPPSGKTPEARIPAAAGGTGPPKRPPHDKAEVLKRWTRGNWLRKLMWSKPSPKLSTRWVLDALRYKYPRECPSASTAWALVFLFCLAQDDNRSGDIEDLLRYYVVHGLGDHLWDEVNSLGFEVLPQRGTSPFPPAWADQFYDMDYDQAKAAMSKSVHLLPSEGGWAEILQLARNRAQHALNGNWVAVPTDWSLTHRQRNRLQHALNGNPVFSPDDVVLPEGRYSVTSRPPVSDTHQAIAFSGLAASQSTTPFGGVVPEVEPTLEPAVGAQVNRYPDENPLGVPAMQVSYASSRHSVHPPTNSPWFSVRKSCFSVDPTGSFTDTIDFAPPNLGVHSNNIPRLFPTLTVRETSERMLLFDINESQRRVLEDISSRQQIARADTTTPAGYNYQIILPLVTGHSRQSGLERCGYVLALFYLEACLYSSRLHNMAGLIIDDPFSYPTRGDFTPDYEIGMVGNPVGPTGSVGYPFALADEAANVLPAHGGIPAVPANHGGEISFWVNGSNINQMGRTVIVLPVVSSVQQLAPLDPFFSLYIAMLTDYPLPWFYASSGRAVMGSLVAGARQPDDHSLSSDNDLVFGGSRIICRATRNVAILIPSYTLQAPNVGPENPQWTATWGPAVGALTAAVVPGAAIPLSSNAAFNPTLLATYLASWRPTWTPQLIAQMISWLDERQPGFSSSVFAPCLQMAAMDCQHTRFPFTGTGHDQVNNFVIVPPVQQSQSVVPAPVEFVPAVSLTGTLDGKAHGEAYAESDPNGNFSQLYTRFNNRIQLHTVTMNGGIEVAAASPGFPTANQPVLDNMFDYQVPHRELVRSDPTTVSLMLSGHFSPTVLTDQGVLDVSRMLTARYTPAALMYYGGMVEFAYCCAHNLKPVTPLSYCVVHDGFETLNNDMIQFIYPHGYKPSSLVRDFLFAAFGVKSARRLSVSSDDDIFACVLFPVTSMPLDGAMIPFVPMCAMRPVYLEPAIAPQPMVYLLSDRVVWQVPKEWFRIKARCTVMAFCDYPCNKWMRTLGFFVNEQGTLRLWEGKPDQLQSPPSLGGWSALAVQNKESVTWQGFGPTRFIRYDADAINARMVVCWGKYSGHNVRMIVISSTGQAMNAVFWNSLNHNLSATYCAADWTNVGVGLNFMLGPAGIYYSFWLTQTPAQFYTRLRNLDSGILPVVDGHGRYVHVATTSPFQFLNREGFVAVRHFDAFYYRGSLRQMTMFRPNLTQVNQVLEGFEPSGVTPNELVDPSISGEPTSA